MPNIMPTQTENAPDTAAAQADGAAAAEKARIWAEAEALDRNETPHAAAPAPQEATAPEAAAPPAEHGQEPSAPEAASAPAGAIPQSILDELAGLRAIVERQGAQMRGIHGHLGSHKQALDALRGREAAQAAPTGEANGEANKPGRMAKLKEDYPEFGTALEEALQERLAAASPSKAEAPDGAGATAPAVVTYDQLERVRRETLVEARHPGWKDTITAPAFSGWLQRQPREIQALADSDAPADAIRLLDLHAQGAAPSSNQPPQVHLAAAAAIPTARTAQAAKTKPFDQMSKREQWQYLNQLEEAQAR